MVLKGDHVLQIAIDGPVAAGKSTVAKRLSKELGLLFVDTGATYRACALAAEKKGVEWDDEAGLAEMLEKTEMELKQPVGEEKDGRKVTVLLDGEDVSWAIRTQEMGEGASVVSQYPEVRKLLVAKQQQMAVGKRVVMEGRDIGTRVLVDAPLKIFMTADVEQRVKWKMQELTNVGQDLEEEEVRAGLVKRDKREETRKTDPLRPAEGAWILDTTQLTIDEVLEVIVQRVKDLGFQV